ncbi:MAG: EamA family transporter [Candidatus Dormibacteraeota bacterium]|nr:EamA family transporter [Candidatus Dormibacteraeota bacterium]
MNKRASGWRVWSALLIVYILWGSTYFGIRVMVETMPPLLSSGLRFGAAALILSLIAGLRGEWRLGLSRGQVLSCALVGVALFAGGNGFVALSEQRIPSGIAALVVACSPLLVALMSLVAFRTPIGVWQGAGMALGFGGLFILGRPGGGAHLDPIGLLQVLFAATCWSLGSVIASRARLPGTPLAAASLQQAFGALSLLLLGLTSGELNGFQAGHISGRSLLALAYLITFGSLVAFTAYSWLVRAAPLSLVFTYVYVNPVVAVALGALLIGERITTTILIGGAVILAGVAIIVSGQTLAQRRTAAAVARVEANSEP